MRGFGINWDNWIHQTPAATASPSSFFPSSLSDFHYKTCIHSYCGVYIKRLGNNECPQSFFAPWIQMITNFPRICSPHSSSPGPVLHNSAGASWPGFAGTQHWLVTLLSPARFVTCKTSTIRKNFSEKSDAECAQRSQESVDMECEQHSKVLFPAYPSSFHSLCLILCRCVLYVMVSISAML